MTEPAGAARLPFAFLLACIVLIIFIEPSVADRTGGTLAVRLNVVGVTVPIVALGLLGARGRRRWLLPLAGAVVALLNGAVVSRLTPLAADAGVAAALMLLVWATLRVFRAVVAAPAISANLVAGALAAYLMLAVAWALAYGLVEVTWPGSINVPPGPSGTSTVDVHTLMYFSAITIMTIGYGDVTPVAPIARTLAVVEGLAGIVFTAVVLGALVGTLVEGGRGPRRGEGGNPT
jgi:hypothetical protein